MADEISRYRAGVRFVRNYVAPHITPHGERDTGNPRVVPLEPGGKKPLGKDWPNQAPRAFDDEALAKAEEQYPGCNPGLVVPPGLLVFDVDPRNGGVETFDKLVDKYGVLPLTLSVKTASGGLHFYFLADERIRFPKNPWGPGIDLITSVENGKKLTGRQVLVPGAVVNGVPYETNVVTGHIAQAPDWMLEAGEKRKTEGKKAAFHLWAVPDDDRPVDGTQRQAIIDLIAPAYDRGQRHEVAMGLAGMVATAGWDRDSAVAVVYELALQAGDPQPGDRVRAVHDTYERMEKAEDVAGFSKLKDVLGEELTKRLDSMVWAAGPEQSGSMGDAKPVMAASTFAAFRCDELAAWEPPQVEYLVNGMLPRGQLTLLAGPPKGGKTTYVTDLVAALVSRRNFCLRPTNLKENECVLWATEEPQELFLERIINEREWSPEMLRDTLVTFRMAAPSHYRWRDFMPQLAKAVNEYREKGHNIALLILDTFQDWSDLQDEDENHTGAVKKELRFIRNFMQETGCAVLILHHTRKAEGGFISDKIRGASALAGMTDGLIIMDGVSNTKTTRKIVARGRTAAMRWEQKVNLVEGKGYVAEEAPELPLIERERLVLSIIADKAKTTMELYDESGRGHSTIDRALKSLSDRKLVTHSDPTKPTSPWTLTTEGKARLSKATK